MPASLSISNTLLALSGRARGRSSISESAAAAAFAFPVAISFLFCNFLHNRQGFSANFGPIILVPIFFCPDFPSFQSFSPLKCAWWDCFRTRVTATLLADRVIRSGCEPLLARSTRTRSAATRFARPRSGHFFSWTRHFGPHANRFSRDLRVLVVLKRASSAHDPDAFSVCLWASIQGIEEYFHITCDNRAGIHLIHRIYEKCANRDFTVDVELQF